MVAIQENDVQHARQSLFKNVEIDPARLGGEPVFRGTRVPVKSLFDHLRAGDPLGTFLEDFPGVTHAQAQAVLEAADLFFFEEMKH